MDLLSLVNLLISVFFLLPGFLIVKLRSSVSEYKELSAFEYSISSIGYSFILFLSWVGLLVLLDKTPFTFYFISNVRLLLLDFKGNSSLLFSPFIAKILVSYLATLIAFIAIAYNLSWIGFLNLIKRAFDITRFTDHLTPWEDFMILNRYNWLSVELKDGRVFLGKVGIFSHSPFSRQLILKRVKDSPIEIYDAEKKKVQYGPEIDMTYLNIDEVATINAIADKNIQITPIKNSHYVFLFLSLAVFVVLLMFTVAIFNSEYQVLFFTSIWFQLVMVVLTGASAIWNLGQLRTFNQA